MYDSPGAKPDQIGDRSMSPRHRLLHYAWSPRIRHLTPGIRLMMIAIANEHMVESDGSVAMISIDALRQLVSICDISWKDPAEYEEFFAQYGVTLNIVWGETRDPSQRGAW